MNFFFSKKTNYKLHFVSRLTAAAAAAAAVATEREERLRRLIRTQRIPTMCFLDDTDRQSMCPLCHHSRKRYEDHLRVSVDLLLAK